MQDLQWESTGRRLAVSFRSPFCREINVAVVLLVLFYFRMEQCYLQLRFFPFGPNFASDVFDYHFFRETAPLLLLRCRPGPLPGRLSPVGWVLGQLPTERPNCIQFQKVNLL